MGRIFNAYNKSYCLNKQADAEFFNATGGVYDCEEVQGLKQYVQHADITRLQHITSVAYISFLVSKKLGLDVNAASKGAVLHDLFYYDWHAKDDGSHRLHGYRHPGFALKNARKLCGNNLSKKEEDIIYKHMWPLTVIPPRYAESFIVSMADKYCATMEVIIGAVPRIAERHKAFINDYNEQEAQL